jgi:hypothetical protein
LRETQEMRGRIYLEDGAISSRQIINGSHVVDSDHGSWHLLVLDGAGRVCGCTRYRQHALDVEYHQLIAAQTTLASCATWEGMARCAVNEELELSRSLDVPFVEIGGWALDAEIRGTTEALRMVLAIYAFARACGGAVGLATATVRHSSASILRRIGGRPLQHQGREMPAYQDLHYKCDMEMLRFYSWAPNPRYDYWIGEIGHDIRNTPVIADSAPVVPWMPMPSAAFTSHARQT